MGHANRDFTQYDKMSTDELKAALRYNIALSDSDEADTDAILYISEVIAQRDKKEHPEKYPSAEMEWKRFVELYMPSDEEIEEAQKNDQNDEAKTHAAPQRARKHSIWRSMSTLSRVASIVLVVLMLGFAGMGVAQAAGYDVFGAVATWTDEIFTFRGKSGNLSIAVPSQLPDGEVAYSSLQEALDAYGVTVPLAPQWIPKDYQLQELEVSQAEGNTKFFAVYSSGEELRIIFSAVKRFGTEFSTVEKTDAKVQEYRDGGIDHYIMENTNCIQAVWINEDFECMLSGNGITSEQIELIINSIYKER